METMFNEQKERFNNPDLERVDYDFLEGCQLFNSLKHWWCYWDKKTDKVYDQYGYLIGNSNFLREEKLR